MVEESTDNNSNVEEEADPADLGAWAEFARCQVAVSWVAASLIDLATARTKPRRSPRVDKSREG